MSEMESFGFGSPSGTTFAFYFFLCLGGFIGLAIYVLCRNPAMRRIGGASTSRRVALIAGSIVGLLVFTGVYFSSLDGFYGLDMDREDVRLVYILPARTRMLPRSDIVSVTAAPAYKGLWQLSIRTKSGGEFTSARSDLARVQAAQQTLTATVNPR